MRYLRSASDGIGGGCGILLYISTEQKLIVPWACIAQFEIGGRNNI